MGEKADAGIQSEGG